MTGGKAFIAYSGKNSEVLYLYKKLEPSGAKQLSCRKAENFTKIGDDYVLDYYLNSSFYGKYILHMTDGKFTSVTYNGAGTDYEKLSGTYHAQASNPVMSPSPKLLKTSAPAASKKITPAKQGNGTYQFTMPGYAVTVTAEFDLYTVTFDGLEPNVKVAFGEKLTKPSPDPEKSGYTFGGWYKDADCKTAWNFGKDTVSKDITLYPKWIDNSIPINNISGKVTEKNSKVQNAIVELFLGTVKVAATVTDANGNYIFENVENGTYNIVVTNAGKTKTVINDSSAAVNVELPEENISSEVEHKGNEVSDAKSDISKTVVGDLDKIAENYPPKNDGDKVTIKLKVEPKADANTPAQQSIKEEAGEVKKIEFLDLSLLMKTNDSDFENIGNQNNVLLTIVIPFNFANVDVKSVMILRNHVGKSEKLNESANDAGEYVKINGETGTIILYAKKFSDYAIAYDTTKESEPDNPQSYHGGDRSSSECHEYNQFTANDSTESSKEINPSTGAGIVSSAFILAAFVPTFISGKNHF